MELVGANSSEVEKLHFHFGGIPSVEQKKTPKNLIYFHIISGLLRKHESIDARAFTKSAFTHHNCGTREIESQK